MGPLSRGQSDTMGSPSTSTTPRAPHEGAVGACGSPDDTAAKAKQVPPLTLNSTSTASPLAATHGNGSVLVPKLDRAVVTLREEVSRLSHENADWRAQALNYRDLLQDLRTVWYSVPPTLRRVAFGIFARKGLDLNDPTKPALFTSGDDGRPAAAPGTAIPGSPRDGPPGSARTDFGGGSPQHTHQNSEEQEETSWGDWIATCMGCTSRHFDSAHMIPAYLEEGPDDPPVSRRAREILYELDRGKVLPNKAIKANHVRGKAGAGGQQLRDLSLISQLAGGGLKGVPKSAPVSARFSRDAHHDHTRAPRSPIAEERREEILREEADEEDDTDVDVLSVKLYNGTRRQTESEAPFSPKSSLPTARDGPADGYSESLGGPRSSRQHPPARTPPPDTWNPSAGGDFSSFMQKSVGALPLSASYLDAYRAIQERPLKMNKVLGTPASSPAASQVGQSRTHSKNLALVGDIYNYEQQSIEYQLGSLELQQLLSEGAVLEHFPQEEVARSFGGGENKQLHEDESNTDAVVGKKTTSSPSVSRAAASTRALHQSSRGGGARDVAIVRPLTRSRGTSLVAVRGGSSSTSRGQQIAASGESGHAADYPTNTSETSSPLSNMHQRQSGMSAPLGVPLLFSEREGQGDGHGVGAGTGLTTTSIRNVYGGPRPTLQGASRSASPAMSQRILLMDRRAAAGGGSPPHKPPLHISSCSEEEDVTSSAAYLSANDEHNLGSARGRVRGFEYEQLLLQHGGTTGGSGAFPGSSAASSPDQQLGTGNRVDHDRDILQIGPETVAYCITSEVDELSASSNSTRGFNHIGGGTSSRGRGLYSDNSQSLMELEHSYYTNTLDRVTDLERQNAALRARLAEVCKKFQEEGREVPAVGPTASDVGVVAAGAFAAALEQ
ncbi:unnamed protein product [Amoebophrya sp. A25]|nr:unnamed protein product [Amoebophrya sp. A25]|eukprot:GSA25T00014957001.1